MVREKRPSSPDSKATFNIQHATMPLATGLMPWTGSK